MAEPVPERGTKRKLHGREFYKSIGSPKYIVAPMVDQSEFAWRLLTRSFMPPSLSTSLLAYTPMFHARMFSETPKYRDGHFQPITGALPVPPPDSPPEEFNLDGHPKVDRPLFVQFCANKADEFLAAARLVVPYCDAVDLNLGCPQGIAKRGGYGAFLQEDWPTIRALISTLHKELDIPVTAKFRVQETYEKTLAYARMILDAGASIITVHGRQRDQKGHNTGLADWEAIRYLRDNLPPDTVLFANGNILQHDDIEACLTATGADGVMSAEGNLYDPSIFAPPPPVGEEGREYFRSPKTGKGGWRMDAALRRYMDILHTHVLKQTPPSRAPLYISGDPLPSFPASESDGSGPPPTKKQKRAAGIAASAAGAPKPEREASPNLTAAQPHLFHLLRPLVARHTNIRDTLARIRAGDVEGLERILSMVESVVAEGIRAAMAGEDDGMPATSHTTSLPASNGAEAEEEEEDPTRSSTAAVARCRRPWFVCQPYVRPLPEEAVKKGAMQVSKKMKRKMEMEEREAEMSRKRAREEETSAEPAVTGSVETVEVGTGDKVEGKDGKVDENGGDKVEVPREGLVCG